MTREEFEYAIKSCGFLTYQGQKYYEESELIKAFEDMGLLEQEPKTGHWIDDKCSVCGKGIEDLISSREWYWNEEPNFCPVCGAKMVEPQAESDHKCHNCKHYTSGDRDGSCGSYICKHYSGWESEDKDGLDI